MTQSRILLVDHEDEVVRPLQDMLESHGMSVACISSSYDVGAAFAFSPRLVVINPDTGREPGCGMIHEISKRKLQTPILIGAAGNLNRLRQARADARLLSVPLLGVVERPYSISALEAVANRYQSMEAVDNEIADADFVTSLILHDRLIPNLTAEYQGIYDLRTGRIAGYEALARLRARRAISPQRIFSRSTDIDLECAATVAIAEAAIRFSASLRAVNREARTSFNCSAAVLAHPEFPHMLMSRIDREGHRVSNLTLEITENERFADFACLAANVTILKQFGIAIAIDDFGTGMSNFDRLTGLPVDELKIDKQLFWSVVGGELPESMLAPILSYCREKKIRTVIEGIETLHHLNCAFAMGADFGQGYYWGKSVPAQLIAPNAN